MKKNVWSGPLKAVLKLSLVAALLYFLSQKGFLSFEATKRAFSRPDLIVPSFALLVFSTLIGIYRWHILLRAQGIKLPLSRTVQLAFVGNFFNIALPGAVSGDVIKAIYVAKEVQGIRARALGSILFDRVVGVSALVMVAGVAWLIGATERVDSQLLHSVGWFLGLATFGVIVFFGYLVCMKEQWDPLLLLLKKVELKKPKAGSLTRVYEGIRAYHSFRWVIFQSLVISFIVHGVVTYACLRFAWALGEETIPALGVFVAVPLGLLVTAVPVAPAGVGTGHAAFSAFFVLLGSQRGADVFSLFILYNLVQGAFGGLIYLRFKSREPLPAPQAV